MVLSHIGNRPVHSVDVHACTVRRSPCFYWGLSTCVWTTVESLFFLFPSAQSMEEKQTIDFIGNWFFSSTLLYSTVYAML